uniref:Ribosomal protein L13 n=1 Tax=Hildenbrandia rivularis TaxID=135206 RepID=A0A1C9CFT1_9FLOR|nr:ribosomal protein L13 [Hildenbrandia rivularis]AOM67222.1 ribosomal protein L13 [Hildenbrandia rivularis]
MSNNYKSWYLINAQGKTLGRLATYIAQVLRGKNQTTYLPHRDNGDYIIVINAADIQIQGTKNSQKIYYNHSNRPGSFKYKSFTQLHKKFPDRAIKIAVKGMLPKNSLGRQIIKKLKVYASLEHPHSAQKPHLLEI